MVNATFVKLAVKMDRKALMRENRLLPKELHFDSSDLG